MSPSQEIDLLLDILPFEVKSFIKLEHVDRLTELVLDLGRLFEYRIDNFKSIFTDLTITQKHLTDIESRLEELGPDGRVGIDGTLHRITAVFGKRNEVAGYTMRIGKEVMGPISLVADIVNDNKSILFVGPPGAGKTSIIRSIANFLSDYKRVIVVDKSGEIGGEGAIPHNSIGLARRFRVPAFQDQSRTMLAALESHTMETCIVDEISTKAEVDAALTIGQRGVRLIATAHGRSLADIVRNPILSPLIGGVSTVTLSDEMALQRGTQKTIQERTTDSTFDVVIEILDFTTVCVHPFIAESVDTILSGGILRPEERRLLGDNMKITGNYFAMSQKDIKKNGKSQKT